MTEAEWLTSDHEDRLLEALRYKGSARKRRLYACALCRGRWYYLTDERSRKAIAVAERYADGLASEQDLVEAERNAQAGYQVTTAVLQEAYRAHRAPSTPKSKRTEISALETMQVAMWAAQAVCYCCAVKGYEPSANVDWYESMEGESAVLEVIKLLGEVPGGIVKGLEIPLRDIFGNPFRPVKLDPSWLTTSVVQVVQATYEASYAQGTVNADDLAVLADALEEAGCTNAEILSHCRSPGRHIRGCWVVDQLLGKE